MLTPGIKDWKNHEGEKCRTEDSSNHYCRQRTLDFRARSGGNRHWYETKARHKRRHQNRSQAGQIARFVSPPTRACN